MSMLDRISYYWGRVVGGITGTNSPEKARETILDDIRRATSEVRVVSCTADMSYWNDQVIDSLEHKIRSHPGLIVEFLVGPKFSNERLDRLAREKKITLLHIPERPPCDCRIIDSRDTYTSNHGDAGVPRKYCWTFGNAKALKDREHYYACLRRSA